MRSMFSVMFPAIAAVTLSASLVAQSAPPLQSMPPTKSPVDLQLQAGIAAKVKALLARAQASPEGFAGSMVENYPGEKLLLWVRAGKDGGGESHANFADFNVVLDGEGTEVTGGKIVDPKEISPGEVRGSKLQGGTPHVLHKGDVLYIAAGVPHQALVAPGKTFVYYTLKIEKAKP
jgi:mannose-6-phosphate isomerase-like protein (cupin superfamily)